MCQTVSGLVVIGKLLDVKAVKPRVPVPSPEYCRRLRNRPGSRAASLDDGVTFVAVSATAWPSPPESSLIAQHRGDKVEPCNLHRRAHCRSQTA